MPSRIQTRRSISLSAAAYKALKRAAALRRVPISSLVEQALGDLTGSDTEAAVAAVRATGRRKSGPKPRPPAPVGEPPGPRYVAVAPPREVRRYPSRERQMLGDAVADAAGFR